MPRSGATYSLPEAAFTALTLAESAKVNSNFSDIADEITASVSRDGSGSMSGNLNMGTHKLTNLSAGSSNGDSVRYEQVQLATAVATAWVLIVSMGTETPSSTC